MRLPRTQRRGPFLSRHRGNQIIEWLGKISAGIGISFSDGVISALGASGGTGTMRNDFSSYASDAFEIGIRNGTVTYNGTSYVPDGMTPGELFTLAVAADDQYAWLKIVVEPLTGNFVSLAIGVGSALPSASSDTGYQALCDFTVDADGNITVGNGAQGIGSQGYLFCGGNHYFWSA